MARSSSWGLPWLAARNCSAAVGFDEDQDQDQGLGDVEREATN
jgi:hypothetical protein